MKQDKNLQVLNEVQILEVPLGKNQKIKLIPIVDLIKNMYKIEYEMDKLNEFGKTHYEHYYTMWQILKRSMAETLQDEFNVGEKKEMEKIKK